MLPSTRQSLRANVLVIDDSESIRKKIRQVLTDDQLVDCFFEAKSGLEGFKLLLEKKISLVFCDVVMPEFDGFKFLVSRSTRPDLLEIPVILMTSQSDVLTKVKGLDLGASDFITKPFDDRELAARARVHLRLKSLQDQLKERNARLLELSGTDELTKIANRRRFMETFESEFARARRHKYSLSFVICDIDFFKNLNDQYGHLTGDQVLCELAKAMRQTLRSSDLLGRYGGEEFTILLPHTSAWGAFRSAERLRANIETTNFTGPSSVPLRLTLSGGVATYPDFQVASIDGLIRYADAALYRAKSLGRNRIETAAAGNETT